MKRVAALFLAVLLLMGCLAGCGNSSKNAASSMDMADPESSYNSTTESSGSTGNGGTNETDDAGTSGLIATNTEGSLADKIIYSLQADLETTDFDKTLEDIVTMTENCGGFLESSNVSGNSYAQKYYGYASYRSAQFILRIPKESFQTVRDGLSQLGNVTSLNTGAENITEQYTDAQARLDTYQVEESRLLAMLEKADTVEDMIAIESRLSDVRYNIESITSTLKNWDNQVNYSTVTLYVSEVEELTEQVATQRTYWQQIGDGLVSSMKSVGRFFKNLFKGIVIALPVILIVVIIAAIIVAVILRLVKKKKAQIHQNAQEKEPEDGSDQEK